MKYTPIKQLTNRSDIIVTSTLSLTIIPKSLGDIQLDY